jgi:hypothetical protein
MSSNIERVAAMPDASLYVNRDGRRADDCVDSHGGGNLIKIPRFRWRDPSIPTRWEREGGRSATASCRERGCICVQWWVGGECGNVISVV